MKEKAMEFFKNEKVKRLFKKIFSKRAALTIIAIIVVVSALRFIFSYMFQIKGTVKSIDGKNITVANFLTSRTVDVGDYPIELKQIQVGDRIEITKNLSGDILSVRDGENGYGDEKGKAKNKGSLNGRGKQVEGNDRNNHMEKK